MKMFSNFQELIDYCPNCIICGKVMELHLRGSIKVESTVTNKWWTLDKPHFHLKMKDKVLKGKWKNYSIIIDPVNNNIILGQNIMDKLLVNWVTVYKKCQTCRYEIITNFTGTSTKNYKIKNPEKFPPLTLLDEEIYFTRRNAKSVRIHQTYFDDSSLLGIRTSIVIGNKPVKSIYIDFNQYKNLMHLNARLSTILTFS